jgi:hypothetical protein
MSSDARLILKRAGRAERWEHQERGDYNMERFDREFSDRLYSEKGREILRAQEQGATAKKAEPSTR